MMTRPILFALAILAAISAANAEAPGAHAGSVDAIAVSAGDDGVLGYSETPGQRASCRRKVRTYYGSAKGRHASSLRLAYIQQCIVAGGVVS